MPTKPPPPPKSRQERLAEALKRNIGRRKETPKSGKKGG
jgi:hypothetical protein